MYRTIDTRFWSDPKIRKLSIDARHLFFYLITNQHTHVSGIYYLPRATVTHETYFPKGKLDTLCDTLTSAGLVGFDTENDLVWVKNMMKYQGRGKKNNISAARHVETLHKSLLINEFLDAYPEVEKEVADTLSIRSPKKSVDATQEQEQEQELNTNTARAQHPVGVNGRQKEENPKEGSNGHARARKYDETFETFWQVYPRKIEKAAAFKEWQLALERATAEQIIAAAEAFAQSDVGRGSPRFILYPERWLKRDKWTDDPAAWKTAEGSALFEGLKAYAQRNDLNERHFSEAMQ